MVGIVVLATLSACGSTVEQRGVAAGDQSNLSVAGSTAGAGTTLGPGGAGGATAGGSLPGSSALSNGARSAGSETGSSVVPSNGSSGVTALRPIKVGIVATNESALFSAFGKTFPDPLADPKEIVKYLNSHGGIAGHQIQPVYYEADGTQDANTTNEAACAAFTQDTHVDIVVNAGLLGDDFPSCLQRAGVSEVDTVNWSADLADMRQHPNWYQPSSMRVDRYIPVELEASLARGFIKSGDTLGVLYEDCPFGGHVFNNEITPFAKQNGINTVPASFDCVTNLVGDLGPVANQVQSAVLKFNTSHVTHVIVVSRAEAFAAVEFTQDASQQHYYPKYIVGSNAYPFNDSQSGAVVAYSRDALPNMFGVGYLPLLDVGSGAKPANAGQRADQSLCAKAAPDLEGAKTASNGGEYFTLNTAYTLCDAFFVTKALLEANGVQFSLAAVRAGYLQALNAGLPSGVHNGGLFHVTPDRLDGGAYARPFAWDAKTANFVYVGPTVSVP